MTVFLLLACIAAAQTPDPARRIEALQDKVDAQKHLLHDWAGLIHYGSDNSELRPPKPGENRVVFLGDDVTELWGQGAAQFFPGKPYLNRGIAGQTSPQMLVRFRQDVVSLKPKVVVIQAGMNDMAGVSGPATEDVIGENLMSMTDIAKANGIRVVLSSALPVCDCFTKQSSSRPQAKIQRLQARILELNEWIKDFAARSGAVYLDYYSALSEGGSFNKELTIDGRLPNEAGYKVMAPLAEKAIAEALGKK
jgi:Lysophospholipase L1 and related esterases